MLGKMISSVVYGIGVDTARDNLVVGSDALWPNGLGIVDTTPSPSDSWQDGQTHTGVTQTSTSGSGTGLTVTIVTTGSGDTVTFTVTAVGSGYSAGDTLVFTDPGSTSETATITLEEASTNNIAIGKDALDSTTSGEIYFRFGSSGSSGTTDDCNKSNDLILPAAVLTFITVPRGLGATIYFNHLSTSTTAHTVRIVEV